MTTRLILGPVLIAALVALFWVDHQSGHPFVFTGLAVIMAGFCSWEMARMVRARGLDVDMPALLLTGFALLGYISLSGRHSIAAGLVAVALGVATLIVLTGISNVWNKDVRPFLPEFIGTLGVFVYVFVPIAILVAIRHMPTYGESLVYALIAICKLGDTGAYFTGKFFGRIKLIPHVSPNKTVEGLGGGLAASVLAGFVCWLTLPLLDSFMTWDSFLLLSLGLGFVSAHGDLVASAIKRGADVKDSSHLLPEFGGMLDLIDNFMLAAPAVAVVLALK
ncbi:MAG: phosphatidate cytidylyltransferase [Planctomycetes bacterium]|nr:phosphatidate cytidylyltransferase [Planctomycetota bacterium]NUQ33341.1 phosphatidate cytidylyltransferase [Planctomycetaceae bacterium]